MKIKLKSLVIFQIYFVLVVEALIDLLHMPEVIRYILDINMIIIYIAVIPNIKKIKFNSASINITYYIFGVLILFVIDAFAQSVAIGQILWAVRNNFFFFFFLVICVALLTTDDVDKIMKNVVSLQVFNVICAIYEFFVLHKKNDNLGGMFGIESGCNGYLNVYICVISIYVICLYINKKCTFQKVFWILGSSAVLATISELKIYYIELIIILVLTILLNRGSINRANLKSIFLLLIIAVLLFTSIQLLAVVNSESMSYLSSFNSIINYSSRTDYGSGDIRISRLTPFSQINEYFFGNNIWLRIFGYGFGACEDSQTFAWFNSSFADNYSFLQYRNLSSSMLYLEVGIFGVVLVVLLFVIIIFTASKYKKLLKNNGYAYIPSAVQIFSVITILLIWYNSTLRREISYLTFFVISILFIYIKEFKSADNIKAAESGAKPLQKQKIRGNIQKSTKEAD